MAAPCTRRAAGRHCARAATSRSRVPREPLAVPHASRTRCPRRAHRGARSTPSAAPANASASALALRHSRCTLPTLRAPARPPGHMLRARARRTCAGGVGAVSASGPHVGCDEARPQGTSAAQTPCRLAALPAHARAPRWRLRQRAWALRHRPRQSSTRPPSAHTSARAGRGSEEERPAGGCWRRQERGSPPTRAACTARGCQSRPRARRSRSTIRPTPCRRAYRAPGGPPGNRRPGWPSWLHKRLPAKNFTTRLPRTTD